MSNEKNYERYECVVCQMTYEEEKGLPELDISPGTKWENLPKNFECPDCGVSKEDFTLV